MSRPAAIASVCAFAIVACNTLAGLDQLGFDNPTAGGAGSGAGTTSTAGGGGSGGPTGGGGAGGAGGAGGSFATGDVICHRFVGDGRARALAAYPDGGFVVGGGFSGSVDFGGGMRTSAGMSDGFLARYGPGCEHVFSFTFGGTENEDIEDIAVMSDGSLAVVGAVNGTGSFGNETLTTNGFGDIVVGRLDGNGTAMWALTFGGAGSDWGRHIAVDAADNIYWSAMFELSLSVGSTVHTSNGDWDVLVSKHAMDGSPIWSTSFGSAANERSGGLAVDGANNTYVTGKMSDDMQVGTTSLTMMGARDGFMAKLDTAGVPSWAISVGSVENTATSYLLELDVRGSGEPVVVGRFEGTLDLDAAGTFSANNTRSFFVSELLASGTFSWAKAFSASVIVRVPAVAIASDDAILVTGAYEATLDLGGGAMNTGATESVFIAELEASGSYRWARSFGTPGSMYSHGHAVAATSDGHAVMAGTTDGALDFGSGPSPDEAYVAKIAR